MDRLFLGLVGGALVGISTVVGTFLIFLKVNINLNKESSLKFKLDFLMGLLLLITAVSLIYPGFLEKNNHQAIYLCLLIFFAGLAIFMLTTKILMRVLETIAINNYEERTSLFFILMAMLKNIPIGLVAGSAINMGHTGEGHSLLTALFFHNLFNGIFLAFSFLSLGMDSLMIITSALACGFFAMFAGPFGGYLSQESFNILPYLMAFTGGAMISTTFQEILNIVRRESRKGYRKIVLGSEFMSIVVFMLIFIVWKEIL